MKALNFYRNSTSNVPFETRSNARYGQIDPCANPKLQSATDTRRDRFDCPSRKKGPLFVVRDLSTWLSGDRKVEERGPGQLDCGVACSYIDMDAPLKIGNRS